MAMRSDLYFRHDVYTLDDSEVMALVYRHHEAGYGVFWAVVERLTAEQTHRMPMDMLVMQVSAKLMSTKPAKVREVIQHCISLGLLLEEDGLVFNERVNRQCDQMESYRNTQSENVKKRWEKYRTAQAENTDRQESRDAWRDVRTELAKGLVDEYHRLCPSLPRVRSINDARISHAGTFMKAFSAEVRDEGFRKAEASDFLKNGNGTWNGASFDWLINKSNFAKVLEGNYDNRRRSSICNDSSALEKNVDGGFEL